jgi:penicillin-binding protein 2
MKTRIRREDVIVDSRYKFFNIVLLAFTALVLFRLWYVQIFRGDYYAEVSQRNRMRKIEIPAPRGMIFDRHGKLILGNRPFFDLVYIPQYVENKEVTLNILSRILHAPVSSFERRLKLASSGPKYAPIILKRNLSLNEVSVIESNKIFIPGIDVAIAPRRDYRPEISPHLTGYLAEIDEAQLAELNSDEPENPYFAGDLVGKQGIERRFEKHLRGRRGYRFIQVDAFGRQTKQQDLVDWELPIQPAVPGDDIELTIDLDLQLASRDAFKGKYGAVVVMNPKTGEVYSLISSPGFDPNMYQEGLSQEEWKALISNPFNPLYDKTTGGEYPPGSVYKAVVAIAALNEGVVNQDTSFFCPGHYQLGDQTFHCWERKGHGRVSIERALYRSCDVYFFEVGVQLGVEKIAEYAFKLGLGRQLGLGLNTEKLGLIPTSAWKQLTTRLPWTKGDTPNVAIGQGYDLVTPMQIANLYSTIANGGTVLRPYLLRRIANQAGQTIGEQKPETVWSITDIRPEVFKIVQSALKEVVMNAEGTGKNARVEGVDVAGKTGSAQVVSLKKNRNSLDVSMKWKEHALFAAFAPVQDPEIVVSVVSENDLVGGGGAAAAPVAGKILQTYFKLKAQRSGQSPLTIGTSEENAGPQNVRQ